jgi:hypothetical protein
MKNRDVIIKKEFKVDGTFASVRAAQSWLKDNGYSYGSMCGDMPIAIQRGEYSLPEKWRNINSRGLDLIDGMIESSDFREGSVVVTIFK